MKKFLSSIFLIGIFSAYVISRQSLGLAANPSLVPVATGALPAAASPSPIPVPFPVPTPTPQPVPRTVPVPPPVQQGRYKNGTYTGVGADAYYGIVQVQAVIIGGKIADVVFLSYPNDRGNSAKISSYAMPILKQEAIATQSAPVDIVSGATEMSSAFNQSLQSALSQAQNG
ncbi:MAG: FMN-binding protein [Candidatus Peregrinibacteria bacterium]